MIKSLFKQKTSTNFNPGLIAFAVLAGLMIVVREYRFGSGNQIEQLPIILRAINQNWLRNDFFTDVASTPGPRMFYASFIAFWARIIPIHWVFLILHLLSTTLTALLTGFLAKDLFGKNAALLTIVLVSAGGNITLGGASFLTSNDMTPQSLVMPLIVGAVWATYRQKPLISAILAVGSAIFHPLIGLEVAAILLATSLIGKLLIHKSLTRPNKSLLIAWIASTGIIALTTWLWFTLISRYGGIDTQRYIEILAYFRHPHHYVPSSFPLKTYLEAFFFLTAVAISIHWLRLKSFGTPKYLKFSILIAIIVLLLCVGGYIFVEIIPSRLWVTAQTFRLLFLVNLIGYLLIAGGIGNRLESEDNADRYEAMILILSTYSATLMGIIFILKNLRSKLSRFVQFQPSTYTGLMTAVILGYATFRPPSGVQFTTLSILFLLFVTLAGVTISRVVKLSLGIGYLTFMVFLLFSFVFSQNPLERITQKFVHPPVLTSKHSSEPFASIARFARENTPQDTVFLTPPYWGGFRILAERAIVVDFKAFPFQEPAMLEWQQRLLDCYGRPVATGFAAIPEMTRNYERITDGTILSLQNKYGITYAVLYIETPTRFPIVFSTDDFKVVFVEK